jgi:tRNA threonylcarbamoyladenosine biosynthesis protein TsaB
MTLVLAFDCAISGLGVAVVRDGTCLASLREEGRDQAARLLPVVASVLRDAGVSRHELSLIAVTTGPGSFTGVRVGLAAARGLAVGLGVPLAGLSTTSVLLSQVVTRDRLVVAAIDSRLGDWFCAIGAGAATPFATTAAELTDRLSDKACVIVGADIGPLVVQLAAAGVDAAAEVAVVDPVAVARLGLAQGVDAWRARNESEGLPRPLYLRGVSITLPDGARRTVD